MDDNDNRKTQVIAEELFHDTFLPFHDSIGPDTLAILIVIRGSVLIIRDNHADALDKNTILRIIPEHLPLYGNISTDFQGKVISLDREMLGLAAIGFSPDTYLYMQKNPVFRLDDEEAGQVLELFDLVRRKSQSARARSDGKVLHCLALALFYELNSCISRRIEEHPYQSLSHKENLYRKFLSLLRENVRRQRSVNFYAGQLCLTPQYISSVLKEFSGMSANKWIDEMLFAEAKLLLFSTENNIQQIADKLNFPDQSSFGKFFKKMAGVSPSSYKKGKGEKMAHTQ